MYVDELSPAVVSHPPGVAEEAANRFSQLHDCLSRKKKVEKICTFQKHLMFLLKTQLFGAFRKGSYLVLF